jgi:hypothetical protein
MDQVYGGSRVWSMGSLNPGHRLGNLRLRLKTRRGILLIYSRPSVYTWTAAGASPSSASFGQSRAPGRHGHQLERAQAWATGHHLWWGFFQHDLGDERNPIYPLTAVETTERKPAMRKRLGQPSTAVGTASGSAPAPRAPLQWQCRCGLLLQEMNWHRRPWQGRSTAVDG